jgi:hypothetical protein
LDIGILDRQGTTADMLDTSQETPAWKNKGLLSLWSIRGLM